MSTPSQELATQQQQTAPGAMIERYQGDFAQVLPTHIKPETWARLAVGVFRRDSKLAQAFQNDPAAGMAALLEAARKGLEPGTEQFYLTPRKDKGVLKVKGIEGYQGIIERIYRAGAAASVIVESVRENDRFEYVPGRDERPIHTIDWWGERGKLKGVYAYAVMKDGATSKVVVLNEAKVMEAKAKSDGADSSYSPWNQGDGEAMWLKTAARRLEKWVPTSSEYIREQLRAVRDVAAEPARPSAPLPEPETSEPVNVTAAVVIEDDPTEGAA